VCKKANLQVVYFGPGYRKPVRKQERQIGKEKKWATGARAHDCWNGALNCPSAVEGPTWNINSCDQKEFSGRKTWEVIPEHSTVHETTGSLWGWTQGIQARS
jgi:hypothetical protein